MCTTSRIDTYTATAYTLADWWRAEIAGSRVGQRRSRNAPGRRGVIIATSLPPDVTGGVFRPTSWICHAERAGWRLAAITHETQGEVTPAGLQLASRIPSGVDLRRVRRERREPSWRLTPHVDGGFRNSLLLRNAVVALHPVHIPDVIVATGPAFSSFLAGYFAARRFRCPLILDYRDEWSAAPVGGDGWFIERYDSDRYWEERCLRCAHTALFTTESQLVAHAALFARANVIRHVLPNGWDDSVQGLDVDRGNCGDQSSDARMVLSFVGHLGPHMPVTAFLSDLEAALGIGSVLRGTLLRIVGTRASLFEAPLREWGRSNPLELIDMVSQARAVEFMRSSAILLLIQDERMCRYIPGKLYEYIASGRPILIYGEPGESSAIVEALGAGIRVPPGSPRELRQALDRLSNRARESHRSERQKWLDVHSRSALADRFFDVLEAVVQDSVRRDG